MDSLTLRLIIPWNFEAQSSFGGYIMQSVAKATRSTGRVSIFYVERTASSWDGRPWFISFLYTHHLPPTNVFISNITAMYTALLNIWLVEFVCESGYPPYVSNP